MEVSDEALEKLARKLGYVSPHAQVPPEILGFIAKIWASVVELQKAEEPITPEGLTLYLHVDTYEMLKNKAQTRDRVQVRVLSEFDSKKGYVALQKVEMPLSLEVGHEVF